MSGFFLGMLAEILTGSSKRRIDAAEAFETLPSNPIARRCAAVAFVLFLATSALFVIAALVDWFANVRPVAGEA